MPRDCAILFKVSPQKSFWVFAIIARVLNEREGPVSQLEVCFCAMMRCPGLRVRSIGMLLTLLLSMPLTGCLFADSIWSLLPTFSTFPPSSFTHFQNHTSSGNSSTLQQERSPSSSLVSFLHYGTLPYTGSATGHSPWRSKMLRN